MNLIHVILDKSGSMGSAVEPTISGFNEFLATMKREVPDASVGLTLFDTQYEERYIGAPIRKVANLTRLTYMPGGNTALYDAIGRTIRNIEALREKPEKVVICIVTDGQENSSHEFNQRQIFDLIAEKSAAGWQFTFLGAEQDAYASGESLGIQHASIMNYGKSPVGTQSMFNNVSSSTSSYLRGQSTSVTYDADQKKEVESHS